jgi:hypothetical protein
MNHSVDRHSLRPHDNKSTISKSTSLSQQRSTRDETQNNNKCATLALCQYLISISYLARCKAFLFSPLNQVVFLLSQGGFIMKQTPNLTKETLQPSSSWYPQLL